ncbi:MAG: hypothetical protein U0790_14195 [Isosphaeraceae bacterium]
MNEGLVIPLAGIMLPIVLVPTILTLKHRHQKRQWLHQERLRALELGLPTADLEPRVGAGSVTAIGAGVPLATVAAAFLATTSIPYGVEEFLPLMAVVWGCAFMICCGAFMTSVVLGIMLMRSRKPVDAQSATKPAFDPDAYDVVSMRG